jgi:hypothetical protein
MNVEQSTEYIKSIYKDIGYFDEYGMSIIIVFFFMLIIILAVISLQTMEIAAKTDQTWEMERCKVPNVFLGGFIHNVPGKSAIEYTKENFSYCMQRISHKINEQSVNPLYSILNNMQMIVTGQIKDIEEIRSLFSEIRNFIASISKDLYARIMNLVIEIQILMASALDAMRKMMGVMTAILYSTMGMFITLKSFLGMVLSSIRNAMIALAIYIALLWTQPEVYIIAEGWTYVYIGLLTTYIDVTSALKDTLGIQAEPITSKPRCFGGKNPIELENGSWKYMKNIVCGDVLKFGGKVTAKMTLSSIDLDMFILDGCAVSEKHNVIYNNEWISVINHPQSKKIKYNEQFVYCLNTELKTIGIGGNVYMDWDEITDISEFESLLNNGFDYNMYGIRPTLYGGKMCKSISSFEIGESILIDDNQSILIGMNVAKAVIYGIVETVSDGLPDVDDGTTLHHLLTTPSRFMVYDTNNCMDTKIVNDYNNDYDDDSSDECNASNSEKSLCEINEK